MRWIGKVSYMGLLAALALCDSPTEPGDVRYEMTFTGDASFQAPHAGDVLTVRSWRVDGPLSDWWGSTHVIPESSQDDVSFGFRGSPMSGERYDVHLWIDSNIGGGTEGVCDSPEVDHKWRVSISPVTGEVDIVFSYDETTVTEVCSLIEALENRF